MVFGRRICVGMATCYPPLCCSTRLYIAVAAGTGCLKTSYQPGCRLVKGIAAGRLLIPVCVCAAEAAWLAQTNNCDVINKAPLPCILVNTGVVLPNSVTIATAEGLAMTGSSTTLQLGERMFNTWGAHTLASSHSQGGTAMRQLCESAIQGSPSQSSAESAAGEATPHICPAARLLHATPAMLTVALLWQTTIQAYMQACVPCTHGQAGRELEPDTCSINNERAVLGESHAAYSAYIKCRQMYYRSRCKSRQETATPHNLCPRSKSQSTKAGACQQPPRSSTIAHNSTHRLPRACVLCSDRQHTVRQLPTNQHPLRHTVVSSCQASNMLVATGSRSTRPCGPVSIVFLAQIQIDHPASSPAHCGVPCAEQTPHAG